MRPDQLRDWAREQYQESAREAAEKRRGKSNVSSLDERKKRIHAELLTKDPIWDEYIARVEALQEATLAEIWDLGSRLASMEYMGAEACATLRHRMAVLKATFDARAECMRIPSQTIREA